MHKPDEKISRIIEIETFRAKLSTTVERVSDLDMNRFVECAEHMAECGHEEYSMYTVSAVKYIAEEKDWSDVTKKDLIKLGTSETDFLSFSTELSKSIAQANTSFSKMFEARMAPIEFNERSITSTEYLSGMFYLSLEEFDGKTELECVFVDDPSMYVRILRHPFSGNTIVLVNGLRGYMWIYPIEKVKIAEIGAEVFDDHFGSFIADKLFNRYELYKCLSMEISVADFLKTIPEEEKDSVGHAIESLCNNVRVYEKITGQTIKNIIHGYVHLENAP